MARLTKRSRQVMRKTTKTYKKKASYKKKSYKSSSKGYQSKSLRTMAKKISASHYLSYGISNIRKKYTDAALMKTLRGQGFKSWSDTYGGLNAATAGVQAVTTVHGVYTPYDIYFANAAASTKHYMKNCQVSVTMTNQCNAPVFVDLYDVVARQDLSTDTSYQSPSETWASTAQNPTYYGADPFACQEFTEAFKVLRITRINLTAGETAEHRCNYKAEQIFSRADLGFLTQDQASLAGLTHFVMMVTRGAPADADNTTVGSAITKVAYIVQKTYKTQTILNVTNQNTVATTLSTAATKIMELDGDENTFATA